MTDLIKLRELAGKATPGDWESLETVVYFGDGGFDLRAAPKPQDRAAFIAAANPTAIIALIDALEAANKRIAELESL